MIAPISTNTNPVPSDISSPSPKTETSTSQISTQLQQSNSTSLSKQSATQDTISISSTALNMSKALNVQHENKVESQENQNNLKEEAQSTDKEKFKAALKGYPPFMGNGEELKALKSSSPALYREILRMIVPPPLNISYSDMLIIQNSNEEKLIV